MSKQHDNNNQAQKKVTWCAHQAYKLSIHHNNNHNNTNKRKKKSTKDENKTK